jgi:hypothetical protein
MDVIQTGWKRIKWIHLPKHMNRRLLLIGEGIQSWGFTVRNTFIDQLKNKRMIMQGTALYINNSTLRLTQHLFVSKFFRHYMLRSSRSSSGVYLYRNLKFKVKCNFARSHKLYKIIHFIYLLECHLTQTVCCRPYNVKLKTKKNFRVLLPN